MLPTAAPRNSVGVNTPPTVPDPTLASVATNFASNSTARNTSGSRSCRMRVVTPAPFPHTSGHPTAIIPTSSPPTIICT